MVFDLIEYPLLDILREWKLSLAPSPLFLSVIPLRRPVLMVIVASESLFLWNAELFKLVEPF